MLNGPLLYINNAGITSVLRLLRSLKVKISLLQPEVPATTVPDDGPGSWFAVAWQ